VSKITVLLADDHAMIRQGLRALLEAEEDMSVVGEAENGRQAVQMAGILRPNVVVMDIAMPLLNGLGATRQISRECPKCRVLILSSHTAEEYVEQLAAAGATGYLLKQTAARELVAGIREANKEVRLARNSCAAPQLEPPRVCIVHKEQKRALVLGKVADADVLLVADIFGKSNGAFIQHFQETRGPSAVLDVGLAIGARGGEIGRVAIADERDRLGGKLARKSSRGRAMRLGFARAEGFLLGSHRRGEHHVVGVQSVFASGLMRIGHRGAGSLTL